MQAICRQFPEFQGFFDFEEFNPLQKECLPKIMNSDSNMIVSAPTSSGKTVIFEIAILKYSQLPNPLCLYLAPIKSLCHQKYTQWSRKFANKLTVSEVTGDSLENNNDKFLGCHIVVGTPEKIDFISRQNLDYLKKIRLLLIDEIHMLNYEERGATLQAIVSRIMSLNSKVRIIAVSATIPNIFQVGQWLRCPPSSVCIFGQEYRPVKIKTIVAGFAHSGNPFTFERILNFKLLEAIRSYSQRKGSLIFCPTQKGTQQACEQIITQMHDREFIDNDRQLITLIQAAKQVSNSKLQTMIPQGVAFHNASLSYQDRSIVERLFLELKVKVLCTTSTLSMGINLPARLVIIKSTQCYRGSIKGYQQYSRIQIEQMMGRAGRPPFDQEGTVVIMTQKSNYNKYNNKLTLENLESQLFNHMLQHINAQISLGSILSITDLESYFFNSFCYIRMKQSPKTYGITGNIEQFIKKNCLKAVKALSQINIIHYCQENLSLSPKPLSISISKNAVEIRSISLISKEEATIETSRQYLMALCRCQQIGKYTSRIEQRKFLKEMNEKNKFSLKEAISNAERKAFVLVQAQLSKFHIQYWQMRRQASDILILLKRLNNCVKTLGFQLKNFWLYYWAVRYQKYFALKYWEHAEEQMKLQVSGLHKKSKELFNRKNKTSENLHQVLEMKKWLQEDHNSISERNQLQHFSTGVHIQINKERDLGTIKLKVSTIYDFTPQYKGVTICVGDMNNKLYHYKYLNQNCKEIMIHFGKIGSQEYKIGLIKDGIVGFDEFYRLKGEQLLKFDPEHDIKLSAVNKKSLDTKEQRELSLSIKERKSITLEHKRKLSIKRDNAGSHFKVNKMKDCKNIQQFTSQQNLINQDFARHLEDRSKKPAQLQLPQKYRVRPPLKEEKPQANAVVKKRVHRPIQQKFRDLKEFNWKPGFEQIPSSQESKHPKNKQLRLVESKDKPYGFELSRFAFKPQHKANKDVQPSRSTHQQNLEVNKKDRRQSDAEDVFSYFYNLF